jgi:hypothetical protein
MSAISIRASAAPGADPFDSGFEVGRRATLRATPCGGKR